jgi:hypothetical protein
VLPTFGLVVIAVQNLGRLSGVAYEPETNFLTFQLSAVLETAVVLLIRPFPMTVFRNLCDSLRICYLFIYSLPREKNN